MTTEKNLLKRNPSSLFMPHARNNVHINEKCKETANPSTMSHVHYMCTAVSTRQEIIKEALIISSFYPSGCICKSTHNTQPTKWLVLVYMGNGNKSTVIFPNPPRRSLLVAILKSCPSPLFHHRRLYICQAHVP